MKTIVQGEHGSPGMKHHRVIVTRHGVQVQPLTRVRNRRHADWYRETLMELIDLLAEGRIRPVVVERVPLVEAARAHELLERGGYAGKVVLVTGAYSGSLNAGR